jgi:hypothetical protein
VVSHRATVQHACVSKFVVMLCAGICGTMCVQYPEAGMVP